MAKYSEEQLERLKNNILDGLWEGKSLIKILEEIKEKPGPKISRSQLYEWINPKSPYYDPEFSDNYARTREIQGDYNAEKVEDIAHQVELGTINPDQARVAIDANKWAAGVKKPKKYGNKQYIEQKTDVTVSREYYDLSCLTAKELDEYERITRKIMVANGEDPDEDLKT